MKENIIQQLARENGYKMSSSATVAYGLCDKWPVTLYFAGNQVYAAIPCSNLDYKEFQKSLKDRLKPIKAICSVTSEKVILQYATTKKAISHYNDGLEAFFVTAKEYGLKPNSTCPYCHTGSCDIYGVHQGHYTLMHQKCHNENYDVQMQNIEISSGNIATGILGAILGAMGVMILCILMSRFLKLSAGYFWAGVPIASMALYKKFNGPAGPQSFIIVLVSTLLSFLFYICSLVYLYQFIGFSFGIFLSLIPSILGYLLTDFSFMGGFWFEILFMLVGLFTAFAQKPFSKEGLISRMVTDHNITHPAYQEYPQYSTESFDQQQ